MTIDRISSKQQTLILDNIDYARNVARKIGRSLPTEMGKHNGVFLDGEDVEQLGITGLIQAAQKFDPEKVDSIADEDKVFKSFAYQRIRGAVLDEFRKQTFVRRRGMERGITYTLHSVDSNPESILDIPDSDGDPNTRLDLLAALDSLTRREQDIVLSFSHGYTGPEIANRLGLSESRISQIYTKAKSKLIEQMA